jgi:hypothetical protein
MATDIGKGGLLFGRVGSSMRIMHRNQHTRLLAHYEPCVRYNKVNIYIWKSIRKNKVYGTYPALPTHSQQPNRINDGGCQC